MDDSELANKARGIAHCLTYNDDGHQAAAKHMLLEMAHRLDSLNVRAHKKSDGLLLINGVGKARYASIKERVLYHLFGVLPRRV